MVTHGYLAARGGHAGGAQRARRAACGAAAAGVPLGLCG
jgi:hypothetical protein